VNEKNIINQIKERENKGALIVISAPSGAGKTTLCHMLIKELPSAEFSISVTSRQPRAGEVDGRDYVFVNEEDFKKRVKEGRMLEWAQVHGNYYGTSKKFVETRLNKGLYVILDIDVQGGLQVKEKFPEAILIFVLPPSMEELKNRLKNRKQDSSGEIKKRLKNSYEEMNYLSKYDYLVINDNLTEALKDIKAIIRADKLKYKK
jgi:guanylate kinase